MSAATGEGGTRNGRDLVVFLAAHLTTLLVLVAVTSCSDSHPPTDPIQEVRVAGTWTGHMTLGGSSESVSVTVKQERTDQVSATWISSRLGSCSFSGLLFGQTLRGSAFLEHVSNPQCTTVFSVTGNASATQLMLEGYQLCNFDPVRFRLDLAR